MLKSINSFTLAICNIVKFCFISLLLLVAGVVVYLNVTAGSAEPGLAKNYEQNRAQILSLRDFAREIRPNKIYFNVLFDGDKIKWFVAEDWDKNQTANFSYSDEKTSIVEPLKILGWDAQTFDELKDKIKGANAVGVHVDDKYVSIYYRQAGWFGMYFYDIFDDSMGEEVKKDYEIGCDDTFAADGVVMIYDGGFTTGFLCIDKNGRNIKRR